MGKFTRFFGKLLIVITLFLFAYDKYKHPNLFAQDYRFMLTQLGKYSSYFGYTLPSFQPLLHKIILGSGLLDAFIGVLLLVGDSITIPLLFLKYLVGALLFYIPWDIKNIKTYLQKITFGNTIAIVGVSLVLLSTLRK